MDVDDDCGSAAARLLTFLAPTYTTSEHKLPKITTTSALDGLRGFAAVSVFFFHVLFSYSDFVEFGYGQSAENRLLIQLPFIRLFYAGHAMVAIFFVVGGYVLSVKPVKQLNSGQFHSFYDSLVSSVFRRGFRLYLPAVIATFVTMLTVATGLWEYPRRFITPERTPIFYSDIHPEMERNLFAQFFDWTRESMGLTNVFTYYNTGFMLPYYPKYDPHLWTVPFEYRSSIILAIVHLAVSRCRVPFRLGIRFLVLFFCGVWGRWELVCFLSGSVLCEIDVLSGAINQDKPKRHHEPDICRENHNLPLPQHVTLRSPRSPTFEHSVSETASSGDDVAAPFQKLFHLVDDKFWYFVFVLGLYLLSCPNFAIDTTPGYRFLYGLIPSSYSDEKRFPHTLGAIFVTVSLTHSSLLRRPFTTPLALYLGKVSYSLYIVHGPIIHIVGYSVTPNAWLLVGGVGWRWWLGLFLGTSVLAVVVVILTDWFWRFVDTRCAQLAIFLEKRCFK